MPDTVGFLKSRLEVHRLNYDEVAPQNLVVPAGETYLLAPEDPHKSGAKWVPNIGCKAKIESLDDLKLWMGIPDAIARKLQPRHRTPPVLRGGRVEVGPLVPTKATASMFEVAKAFLVGDSALHAENLEAIWELVEEQPTQWFPVLADVTIEHDALLILSPSVNKFIAGNIYIKRNGQMRVQSGFIKLECVSITGNLP